MGYKEHWNYSSARDMIRLPILLIKEDWKSFAPFNEARIIGFGWYKNMLIISV